MKKYIKYAVAALVLAAVGVFAWWYMDNIRPVLELEGIKIVAGETTAAELFDAGFEVEGIDGGAEVEPHKMQSYIYLLDNSERIAVMKIYNDNNEKVPVKDCVIASICINGISTFHSYLSVKFCGESVKAMNQQETEQFFNNLKKSGNYIIERRYTQGRKITYKSGKYTAGVEFKDGQLYSITSTDTDFK